MTMEVSWACRCWSPLQNGEIFFRTETSSPVEDSTGKGRAGQALTFTNSVFALSRYDVREECLLPDKFGKLPSTSADRRRRCQGFLRFFIHSVIHHSFILPHFPNVLQHLCLQCGRNPSANPSPSRAGVEPSLRVKRGPAG